MEKATWNARRSFAPNAWKIPFLQEMNQINVSCCSGGPLGNLGVCVRCSLPTGLFQVYTVCFTV